jgi:hypothetical protein
MLLKLRMVRLRSSVLMSYVHYVIIDSIAKISQLFINRAHIKPMQRKVGE